MKGVVKGNKQLSNLGNLDAETCCAPFIMFIVSTHPCLCIDRKVYFVRVAGNGNWLTSDRLDNLQIFVSHAGIPLRLNS